MKIKSSTFLILLTVGAAGGLTGVLAPNQQIANAVRIDLSGGGTDMWVGEMGRKRMFNPHQDFCDPATEAFVQITPDGRGFCIEKAARPPELWEEARHIALQEGKRLPELFEWKLACQQAAALGITDMTGTWQWASNFVMPAASKMSVDALMVGSVDCSSAQYRTVAGNDNYVPLPFRCVR